MSIRLGARALAHIGPRFVRPVYALRSTLNVAPCVAPTVVYRPARFMSSTPHGDPGVDPSIPVRDMTDDEYHEVADEDMDLLHERLEDLVENFSKNWEVEYSSGVMTLELPPHGTYVINKQPPTHQLWVSSPVSGPSRYSLSPEGVWVHHRRKGIQLGALLEQELRDFLKEQGNGEDWEGVGLK